MAKTTIPADFQRDLDTRHTLALIDRALDCRNRRRFHELCALLKQQKARKP